MHQEHVVWSEQERGRRDSNRGPHATQYGYYPSSSAVPIILLLSFQRCHNFSLQPTRHAKGERLRCPMRISTRELPTIAYQSSENFPSGDAFSLLFLQILECCHLVESPGASCRSKVQSAAYIHIIAHCSTMSLHVPLRDMNVHRGLQRRLKRYLSAVSAPETSGLDR